MAVEALAFSHSGVLAASNLPEVQKALAAFPRDQLPFATALALTRLAVRVRDLARQQLRNRFDVRSNFVIRSLTFDLTRKREWPKPTVKVGHEYGPFALHEVGGLKKPLPGFTEVFIPTRLVASQRSASTGRIPKSLRARELLRSGKGRIASARGLGPHLRLRTEKFGRGGKGVRRVRLRQAALNERHWLKVTHLLRPAVKIAARFGFRDLAEKVARYRYGPIFLEAMDYAVKTRKPL